MRFKSSYYFISVLLAFWSHLIQVFVIKGSVTLRKLANLAKGLEARRGQCQMHSELGLASHR